MRWAKSVSYWQAYVCDVKTEEDHVRYRHGCGRRLSENPMRTLRELREGSATVRQTENGETVSALVVSNGQQHVILLLQATSLRYVAGLERARPGWQKQQWTQQQQRPGSGSVSCSTIHIQKYRLRLSSEKCVAQILFRWFCWLHVISVAFLLPACSFHWIEFSN